MSPGATLRDWLNARDLRRWQRRRRFPHVVERIYWSAYEYHRDRIRLQQHGYRVREERDNSAASVARVDVAAPFFDKGIAYPVAINHYGAWLRRVPVTYRVSYERLSETVWGPTVAAASGRGW